MPDTLAVTMQILGAMLGLVVALALGASHLAAGRNPYRNFVTQLVFGWYEAHSPYEGAGLRRLLIVCAIFYFIIGAVCAVAVIIQLAR